MSYKKGLYLLFNIKKDPLETKDLSRSKSAKNVNALADLKSTLEGYRGQYLPKITQPVNSDSVAEANGGVWSPGAC